MSATRLTTSDRAFFSALGEVVFGNPFSDARDAQIVRLAPDAKPGEFTNDPGALARVVGPRLAPWLRDGLPSGAGLPAQDRGLLEPALLYVVYHRCLAQFDAHIDEQARQGGTPLRVAFAGDAIGQLVRGGLPEERAVRYFAFYFQLRRAFYFIVRGLAGGSPSMRRLREALWNNIFTHDMRSYEAALWNRMEDFSTLLLGETGTGKGSAAAAIGRSGFIPYLQDQGRFAANFAETFIAINLSQFPEALIESELFGHRKGAFTGAVDSHEGVFARCSAHGALFLDEIGEVSIPVQIKLLNVLQDRSFTPLGSHQKRAFAGRVIAATNQPLDRLRSEGRFRQDFFYRLCSDVIEVPTLRARIAESASELEAMVALLVDRTAGTSSPDLVGQVLDALAQNLPAGYPWPGNVRELEQAVRRILLSGRYAGEVSAAAATAEERLLGQMRGGELSAADLLGSYCALLYRQLRSYTDVARRIGLDWRTVRRYVESEDSNRKSVG